MAYGVCDARDCEDKTFKGWRPLNEPQENGKQLCKRCWARHVDPNDEFDLFDEFGFKRPRPKQRKELVQVSPGNDDRKPKRCGPHLQRFIKAECACWLLGQCTLEGPCVIIEYSRRCGYFEKNVLPPPAYSFKHLCFETRPTVERMVRSEYAEIRPDSSIGDRFCECGNPLSKRQRLCEKCRKERRREAYRRSRRKKAG